MASASVFVILSTIFFANFNEPKWLIPISATIKGFDFLEIIRFTDFKFHLQISNNF